MYLELSRPRGEVSRWNKVYERLQLLNNEFPLKLCKKIKTYPIVSTEIRKTLFDFIVSHERILANIELDSLYRQSLKKKNVLYSLSKGSILLFFSPDLKKDSFDIKNILPQNSLRILYIEGKGDLIQNRVELYYDSLLVAVLLEETACHSYNTVKTDENRLLKIASLDTLINLYYSLYYFTNFKVSICSIASCIRTLNSLRLSKVSQFPAFSITCSGYQKGYPTLLREKMLRIEREKSKNKTLKKKR
jgi:hypothetical protein